MFDTTFARDVQQTLERFRRTMDEAFGDFLAPAAWRGAGEESQAAFAPAVETGWNDESLNLRVVLPGVSEGDVKVNLQGNQLIIEGERKAPENFAVKGGSLRLPYGKFYRAIDLPNGLDHDRITCRLRDGVLDIQFPVEEAMKPRRIRVETADSRKALAA